MKINKLFKYFSFKSKKNSTTEVGGFFRADLSKDSDSSDKEEKDKSLTEIKKKIEARYKKIKSVQEIAVFQKEATELILGHLSQTEYGKHQALMREIRFLLYYTFAVLQDDFFLGKKFFKNRMTRIDDYLFSQYSREEKLERNIKKLKIVAASNRFNPHQRKNLLSYFVFMEETGFEVIMLLNDYYEMLENSQKKRNIFDFKIKNKLKITKDYKKEDVEIDHENSVFKTLQTQQTTQFMTPFNAQKQIFEDLMNRQKGQKEKKST